ncbi:MAG TPA: NAD(P)H-dependent oxidoreductase [Candidatus Egerieicola pullicola]|uniref:NAD(P)H-dependent oxidoreductase n=1 Tax=Candidatus Egerieicola pullicola TaxID=2840775 RepID=A0A9D1DBK5_9FIRM|nr:NAD(P)H-dependent oxidoreductase [Candidatus Egerieicola pullicola]
MKQTLVAFFSAGGTTKRAAETLAKAIGAGLYEIRPAQPYTPQDLNWRNPSSRSSLEQKDPACRPKLADTHADLAGYDRIFLGFPIWWYTAPAIIRSFLECCDFTGKTIVLFATSGGSGLGSTAKDLASSCPGGVVLEGKLLNGPLSQTALKQWADRLA